MNYPGYDAALQSACKAGQTLDTAQQPVTFYETPSGVAMSIVERGINRCSERISSTLTAGTEAGLAQVPANTGTMGAVFAQAFSDGAGYTTVIASNKAASPPQTLLVSTASGPVDGGAFVVQVMQSPSPDAVNPVNSVVVTAVQTQGSGVVQFTLPPYSVGRVDW